MTITTIGIAVDSRAAAGAAKDLDNLAASGAKAERSIDQLGSGSKQSLGQTEKAAASASRSIDDYIKKLQISVDTQGKSANAAKIYELATKGASKAQLEQVATLQLLKDGYEKGVAIGDKFKESAVTAFKATAVAAAAAGVVIYALFKNSVDTLSGFQQLSETTGIAATNFAALQGVFATSGKSAEDVATFVLRMNKALAKTDDESAVAGQALKGLGLDLASFKASDPKKQLDDLAVSLAKFQNGPEKATYLEAIVRGGSHLLSFFQDLEGAQGRQSKTTAEQIERAKEYDDAQKNAKVALQEYIQVISTESLPALTSFTKTVKEAIGELFGIGETSKGLKNDDSIATFAKQGAQTLGILIDAASVVSKVFVALGKTIAAAAATATFAVKGEFSAAANVFASYKDDISGLIAGNGKSSFSEKLAKNLAATPTFGGGEGRRASGSSDPRSLGDPGTIKQQTEAQKAKLGALDFSKGGKGKDTAAQEAKAQLAFDLDEIKKSFDAIIGIYTNSGKILEAQKSATLVTETEYFTQKKRLLSLEEEAELASLQQQKARLEQEQLTGKNKIDNDRKILDVESKITKQREKAATDQEVLALHVITANKKITDSYRDAQLAAANYLDQFRRSVDVELEGIGKGDKFRQNLADRSAAYERFASKKSDLDKRLLSDPKGFKEQYDNLLAIEKDFFDKELSLLDERNSKRLEKERDWVNGATEALQNYYDESRNIAKQTEGIFGNAFKGLEDSLTEFLTKGKADWKSFANSIVSDITRAVVKQNITGPLAEYLNQGMKSGTGAGGGIGSFFGSLFGGGKSDGSLSTSSSTASFSIDAMAEAARSATLALSSLGSGTTGGGGSTGGGFWSSLFSSFFGGGSSSGFGTGSAYGNMDYGGFFADGGMVRPNTINRVNERGPEMLNVAGRQFLMMGNQGGSVTPNNKIGGGMTVHQTINISGATDKSTTGQIGERAARGLRMAQARNG